MKKINVKATIFLSAIVLVVVVLLLNLIEFRKTVDFTVPGIQMPKENAFGKQEEVQVSVNGTYYYRVLPWIHGSTFHGQISFVGEGEEPQNYFFTYGASRGFLKEGRGAGWIGTPDAQTTGGTECGKRDDIRRESRQLCFISGGNTGRSLCHSGYMVSGNAGE